ncbi:DNA repair protein XRCC2-like [Glandiceps talaboti]
MCACNSESGAQLLARLGTRPNLDGIDPRLFTQTMSLKPGNIIEVCGESGCGKTEMLLHWIAHCILPDSWQGVPCRGRDVDVLFIDNDCHFSILRLVSILESKVEGYIHQTGSTDQSNNHDVETLIKSCLQHFHYERCHNTVELLVTIEMLETLLGNKPNIAVVMVDSISAFYWMDRNNYGETKLQHLTSTLQKVTQDYQLVTFLTNSLVNYNTPNRDDNGGSVNSWHLNVDPISRIWQKISTKRYFMWKRSASEFTICLQSQESDQQRLFITDGGVQYV